MEPEQIRNGGSSAPLRNCAKQSCNIISALLMLPFSCLVLLVERFGKADGLFRFFSQSLSLVPGLPGILLRRGFYRIALRLDTFDFTVDFGTIFAMLGSRLGKGAYIGSHCTIGLADIEADVLIGSGVHLVAGKKVHHFESLAQPIRFQGRTDERIVVGRGSWIGNGAVIMASVGEECVIGAGSVVTKACEPFGVYAGNPASKIRDRRTYP